VSIDEIPMARLLSGRDTGNWHCAPKIMQRSFQGVSQRSLRRLRMYGAQAWGNVESSNALGSDRMDGTNNCPKRARQKDQNSSFLFRCKADARGVLAA